LKKALGVIPARYQSSRFPGKSLAPIMGKTMIQRVFERAKTAHSLSKLVIATDDERIFKAARDFGADVLMTSSDHSSGTERVAEVARQFDFPIVINIQGDEPLLRGESIEALVKVLQKRSVNMASSMTKVTDPSIIGDRNRVKVVVDKQDYALYFSRSPLPYQAADYFYQHTGIYGYQRDFLLKLSQWPPTRLEKTESLEQLRVLENGFRIKMLEMPFLTLSVDIPQDIIKVEEFLNKEKNE
jgi:3-deoxy-manno-octulosonate cytidylyltransferase (CMP-KDO synthetase)